MIASRTVSQTSTPDDKSHCDVCLQMLKAKLQFGFASCFVCRQLGDIREADYCGCRSLLMDSVQLVLNNLGIYSLGFFFAETFLSLFHSYIGTRRNSVH